VRFFSERDDGFSDVQLALEHGVRLTSSALRRSFASSLGLRPTLRGSSPPVPRAPRCPRHVESSDPYRPSPRSIASRAPRSPLARQASAFLGMVSGPFSAHRHLRFQRALSQTTLAQGVLAVFAQRKTVTPDDARRMVALTPTERLDASCQSSEPTRMWSTSFSVPTFEKLGMRVVRPASGEGPQRKAGDASR
jgi:hypothetical protein